jgi:hypothetical protein
MSDKQHWTAEQTAHPDAKNDRWAIIYDATPGGRDNGDGTRSFSMRFPALLLSDCVSDPEASARSIADELNAAPHTEALADALAGMLDAFGGYFCSEVDAAISAMEAIGRDRWSMDAQMRMQEASDAS